MIYYGNIKMSNKLDLQGLRAQFPFLVPLLAHPLTTRYLFPLPNLTVTSYPAHLHLNSTDLTLSLPDSCHFPSRSCQQVQPRVKLHQTASGRSTLQSVPPSKETSWHQNKLPSIKQRKPNFLCQAQG